MELALEKIQESKTNQRKSFEKEAMLDLQASIEEQGILQPLLVRNLHNGEYEVIAGARRLRAAKKAGLKKVPVLVVPADDVQALQMQVVENLQREDLAPLEEAEGIARLRETMADVDIATRLGKTKTFITQRCQINGLPPPVKALIKSEELPLSFALLVGRIPNKQLQVECAKEMAWAHNIDDARATAKRYMATLKGAPFPLDDQNLVAKAGACTVCLKRTGNQAEMFAEVKDKDVCTDRTCFQTKCDAQWKRVKQEVGKTGEAFLEGDKAQKALQSGKYVRMDEREYSITNGKTYAELLKKAKINRIHTYYGGRYAVVVGRAAATAAIKLARPKAAAKAAGKTTQRGTSKATKEKLKMLRLASELAMKDIHANAKTMAAGDFVSVVTAFLLSDLVYDVFRLVVKRHDLKFDRFERGKIQKYVSGITVPQAKALVMEAIALHGMPSSYIDEFGESWLLVQDWLDIDMKPHLAEAKALIAAPKKKGKAA